MEMKMIDLFSTYQAEVEPIKAEHDKRSELAQIINELCLMFKRRKK